MSGGMITQRGNQIIESDGEDSKINSFCHNLSGLIDIQPWLEWIIGVRQAGGHDVEFILQSNVVTESCTSAMIPYQPSIKWIGFRDEDTS